MTYEEIKKNMPEEYEYVFIYYKIVAHVMFIISFFA